MAKYVTMNVEKSVINFPSLVSCGVELYRRTSSLLSGFPRGSVMLRFSDVMSILESSAKFTRLSSTRAPHTLDHR